MLILVAQRVSLLCSKAVIMGLHNAPLPGFDYYEISFAVLKDQHHSRATEKD